MNDSRGIYRYNDYELLYLIKCHCDDALEILLWKYSFLIKARIRKFNIPQSKWDDYYQEGNLMLLKALKKYDDNSMMTFTNYFDLLWTRKLIGMIKKDFNSKLEYLEEFDSFAEIKKDDAKIELFTENELANFNLSTLEKEVYTLYFLKEKKIEEIALILGTNSKNISNTKQRIIKKMRTKMKIDIK